MNTKPQPDLIRVLAPFTHNKPRQVQETGVSRPCGVWIPRRGRRGGARSSELKERPARRGDPTFWRPTGASGSAKPARTIAVRSTATVKAQPDEAVVDLGVRSESADSTEAFARNAEGHAGGPGCPQGRGHRRGGRADHQRLAPATRGQPRNAERAARVRRLQRRTGHDPRPL